MTEAVVKTYRYRVKDKHAARLNRMARAASFVWNFANETQRTAVQRGDRWPSYFSTVTCSDCGLVGGPAGRKGLVIREWTCSGCGTVHDRDVNAAANILRWGCPAPTGAESLMSSTGERRHH